MSYIYIYICHLTFIHGWNAYPSNMVPSKKTAARKSPLWLKHKWGCGQEKCAPEEISSASCVNSLERFDEIYQFLVDMFRDAYVLVNQYGYNMVKYGYTVIQIWTCCWFWSPANPLLTIFCNFVREGEGNLMWWSTNVSWCVMPMVGWHLWIWL